MIDRKKFLKYLTYLMFLIFIIDLLALKFYWYFSIWWSDMLMHFFGGLWLGLAFIWFLLRKNISFEPHFQFICQTISFVLLIGVLWEFFEFFTNNYIGGDRFNILDTVSDIFFDLAGGTFAILYFFKKIMIQSKDSPWGNSLKDCP